MGNGWGSSTVKGQQGKGAIIAVIGHNKEPVAQGIPVQGHSPTDNGIDISDDGGSAVGVKHQCVDVAVVFKSYEENAAGHCLWILSS